MLAGAAKLLLIVTGSLILSGIPFAIWLYLDYRKYCLRAKIEDRLQRWVSQ